MPHASVIVPTRNRAPVLRRCLQSLAAQTLAPEHFEVIVVDNGSSDDTAAVARAFEGPLNLRLLQEPEPGLHVGRHAGWRAARSSVLMFCDDDIQASAVWVQAVVRRFEDPSVAMVGGNNLPAWESEPPAWLRRWWERPAAHGRALSHLSVLDFGSGVFDIDPGWIWGCNFSVRAQVLQRARGFHPDGVPRERLRFRGDGETHVSDTVRNSGARAIFDGAATVHHLVDTARMTVDYVAQRAFAQGVSDSYTRVRRQHGPDAARRPPAATLKDWLRSAAAPWRERRSTGAWLGDEATAQWRRALAAARRGHASGYAFHQQAVREDPALLAWVMKEDYL